MEKLLQLKYQMHYGWIDHYVWIWSASEKEESFNYNQDLKG